MKHHYLFLSLFLFLTLLPLANAQETGLPKGFAPFELELLEEYYSTERSPQNSITTAPTSPVRSMAEWEEIQSITITWTSYPEILREIVRHAKEQCEVIIICSNETSVKNYLTAFGINDTNVTFIEEDFNSIWIRDYGQNTLYINEVDTLILLDWIYNRPRPFDDAIPETVAAYKVIDLYSTTAAPTDLVHTGGNYMSDGLGTAFSSKLVLNENGPNGGFNVTVKNEAGVDQIMQDYMGIERYIKMEILPYDGIHHIDMHMKLLDEETLLIGEYPPGVADGPQIEANIQYVLNNFNSSFGTPYEVIRIPMPPDFNDHYPDWNGGGWNTGDYRTYANLVFVNKLVLVPIYEEEHDTTALKILEKALPGYEIVGIDCNDIITALGAIHCITKAIGTDDPLWIVHQELEDTNQSSSHQVDARVRHREGVSSSQLFYRNTGEFLYSAVPMVLSDPINDIWTGFIPGQSVGTIQYYIKATAVNGKEQVRPIVAPDGYFEFDVTPLVATEEPLNQMLSLKDIFPNPASAITAIPVYSNHFAEDAKIDIYDILGRLSANVYQGSVPQGESMYFFNAQYFPAGSYFVRLQSGSEIQTRKLVIK